MKKIIFSKTCQNMKKALLPALLLSACLAQAQTITITATGATDNSLMVRQPVNGFYALKNTWPIIR